MIGGKEKNKHASQKFHYGRGAVGKAIVVGVKQRDGKVIAQVIDDTKAKTLHNFIKSNVEQNTQVFTDNFTGYKGLSGFQHQTVNHSVGEYIKGQVHTNGIESFWALLKRGYYGIFHHMSFKHLHRYVSEFTFCHNTTDIGSLAFIEKTIERMSNKRLTYKELVYV